MRVHVERTGSGPPVVCTHGIGVDRHTFDGLVNELATDHTVVTWDLPGHGQSEVFAEPEAYDRDRLLEDLDDIVASVDAPPIMLGHSLGGYVTLAWAVTRIGTASGLVILSTGPGFRDPAKREAWNDMSRRNAHRFGVAEPVTEMNLQNDSVVIERLGSLDVPVELLVGSNDRPQLVGGMQYLEAKVNAANLEVVDGVGHAVHQNEGAAVVAAAVRRFTGHTAEFPKEPH